MNNSIGFFDSGVGGTSIWKEVTVLLPKENTIYLADSRNAPYGEKSKEKIIDLSIKNTEFLLNQNCKLIIVACNTATTNAIHLLRESYNVPFIGIEPAIKPAGLITKTKKIGILATKGTLNSKLFEQTSEKIGRDVSILEQVGDGLVELIEKGEINSPRTIDLLKKYLNPMVEENIDALVLGCTHYPYLIEEIRKIIGNKIQIIDSGLAVAKQTKNILQKLDLLQQNNPLLATTQHVFYSNKNSSTLRSFVDHGNHIKILEHDF